MKFCYQKKVNAGCPQWIIDGVRAIREQATNRSATAGAVAKESTHGKETGRNTTEPGQIGIA